MALLRHLFRLLLLYEAYLSSFKKVSDDGIYELQGAATCIDNSTGNVVAIVGSRSQDDIDERLLSMDS